MRRDKIWIDYSSERGEELSDFLNLDTVLSSLGTNEQFISYLHSLKSCIREPTGHPAWPQRTIAVAIWRPGDKRTVTGRPYCFLPMTPLQRRIYQAGYGESIAPAEWIEAVLRKVRIEWAISRLRGHINFTGNRGYDMRTIERWADHHGLLNLLNHTRSSL